MHTVTVSWCVSEGHLGVSLEGAANWWRSLGKVTVIIIVDLLKQNYSKMLMNWINNNFDDKPTKSVVQFEENKFYVGCRQFLLDCCTKLIKTYNPGRNANNKRRMKNKTNENVQWSCLFSKWPKLLVNFCLQLSVYFTTYRFDFLRYTLDVWSTIAL